MKQITLVAILAALCTVPASGRSANAGIETKRVQFERGASSAVVEDRITGDEVVDYVLGAAAGQVMTVSLATDGAYAYFNILAPGEADAAFFIGSTSSYQFEGTLPTTGDYTIRVYQMRSAGDRSASYRLEMIITGPRGASPGDSASPAEHAGQGDFDATGQIPCAQLAGQPMGQCDFGVARGANGEAAVVVTRPDGTTRALFFVDGAFNSADTSQADGYPEYGVSRQSDLNLIHVGDERYEIPDALVQGG